MMKGRENLRVSEKDEREKRWKEKHDLR